MTATAVEIACSESLSLARIAQRVEAVHGPLPCSLSTLASTLKSQGITYKRARYSLKKRDSRTFAKKSALLDKLKDEVPPEHYRLVYFDETGFAASPPIQYGWGPVDNPIWWSLRVIVVAQCWEL